MGNSWCDRCMPGTSGTQSARVDVAPGRNSPIDTIGRLELIKVVNPAILTKVAVHAGWSPSRHVFQSGAGIDASRCRLSDFHCPPNFRFWLTLEFCAADNPEAWRGRRKSRCDQGFLSESSKSARMFRQPLTIRASVHHSVTGLIRRRQECGVAACCVST